jgi:carbamoyltransferase
MSVNVVGISAHFHDSACAVMRDGILVAAASEERFSRRKYDWAIPRSALRYCLRESGLTAADVDCVAYYEDPYEKAERQIWMTLHGLARNRGPLGRLDPERPQREIRQVLGFDKAPYLVKHHQAHAASAFFLSGFEEAAILTVDGVGEWTTTAYGRGCGGSLELFEEVRFPHSLGLFYSTLTSYLGFGVNDGEYKMMGLAPYGRPRYVDRIALLIESLPGGQYRLNPTYFDFTSSARMFSDELPALLGARARAPREEILQFHQDVARSAQVVLEQILLEKVHYLREQVHTDNLCMAGGVALNCVANAAILRSGPFKRLFVQPAAGDAGGAIGAAALAYRALTAGKRPVEPLEHVYLGPGYSTGEIERLIDAVQLGARDFRGAEDALLHETATQLAAGKVIGWFHARMEFGPRALGARSILADPRNPTMRDRINALVKKREAFRPFAPAVLLSKLHEHFALDHPSPFMLETCAVTSPLDLPAITHVDGSARVQTVDPVTNPRFARLLEAFERLTGCPILLNTSFNMKDEPIVCTPADALICFWRSNIDMLVLEDFVIDRSSLATIRRGLVGTDVPISKAALTHRIYTFF